MTPIVCKSVSTSVRREQTSVCSFPDGRPLESHIGLRQLLPGYSLAKQLLLDALDTYSFDGVDVSGEATGYLWLPFFLQLAADPDLQASRSEPLPAQSALGQVVQEVLRPG